VYIISHTKKEMLKVIDIPVDALSAVPLPKEHRARRSQLYTIHDIVTNTMVISQKLTDAAIHLNRDYASNHYERVCARGLYQAANKHDGYTGGLHKMRFRVSRCDLSNARSALQGITGIDKAQLLTAVVG
jgi:hypothetical protein